MREIRYRAWDNAKDKMYYVGEEGNISFGLDSNGIVAYDITEEEEEFKILHHLQYMQYTGLKDKNGKEIYEGDIVKGKNYGFNNPQRYIGEVTYVYNRYEVKGINKYKGLRDELNTTYEVIGNIHENPELLKN